MQIMHIAPLNCTKAMHSRLSVSSAMCLTHLVETNKEYAKFYSDFKGYKVLDNSLIELGGSVELQRVLSAAQEIRANEIILPDKFQDGPGTVKLVKESIDELRELGKLGDYSIMAVAHGSIVEEWVWCFRTLSEIPEVNVIGIPKITAKLQPGGRPALESIWKNSPKVIHLLGLWYAWNELASYLDADRIRSVDTCQAAFLAKYRMDPWSVRPDGFTIDLQDNTIPSNEFMHQVREARECISL